MQKRVVVVSAAAATLGLAAAVLGFAAEYFKHKAFVRSDTSRCEYRRTPALGCGIAAALLSLTGLALVTAASRCFRRRDDAFAAAAESDERRCVTKVCATLAWLLVAAAAAMFLYGASRNAGRGRRGSFTAVERQPGRTFDFVYRCPELRDGLFVSASINAGIGIACAIAAYVDLHKKREHQTVTLGVAMGQPYPPAPVAYNPAQPPYGGYGGAKQPAGTA
ncbi:hypothetical protein SETIT_4G017500v2 [Setaria italica]|uniref:Uncharacterized protein n=2 Tax=Setaria italica TaxID=4555 RepID=K3XZ88_SETIT|nr:hypothetical protein SETIT_4G017500v2 [Setaria italica]